MQASSVGRIMRRLPHLQWLQRINLAKTPPEHIRGPITMEKSAAMNRDWIATARTLSEALPYLQRYDGAVVVIKIGGHAMGDDKAMLSFARDIVTVMFADVYES